MKIIAISNEQSFQVGEIVQYQAITKAKVLTPIVRFYDNHGVLGEKEYLCMAIIQPYSDELISILSHLTAKEQFHYAMNATINGQWQRFTIDDFVLNCIKTGK
jgi:hypothetical protein